jgi:hypothetical protein
MRAALLNSLGCGWLDRGGVLEVPLAGFVTKVLPQRVLMIAVGGLITLLAIYQTLRLL